MALSLVLVEKKHLKAGRLQEWKTEEHEVQLGCFSIIISVRRILFAALSVATMIHIRERDRFMQNLLFLFWWVLQFWGGGGRGHATRTLSGSCHPRRGAALKEAESSRDSLPPLPRLPPPLPAVPVHVKWSQMRNRDLSPWSPPRWEHGGRRRQTLCEAPYFSGREEKVEMTERVPFSFFCPCSAPPAPHLQFIERTTMVSPNCPWRNSATPAQLCEVSRLHKAVFRPSIFNLLLLSLPFSPLSSSLLRSSSRPVASPALPFIPLTLLFSPLCLTFSFVRPWRKTLGSKSLTFWINTLTINCHWIIDVFKWILN